MPQVLGETIARSPRDIELEVNGGGRIKLRDYDEGCAKLFALLLYEAYPDIDPGREVWHEISLRYAMAYAFGATATGSNTARLKETLLTLARTVFERVISASGKERLVISPMIAFQVDSSPNGTLMLKDGVIRYSYTEAARRLLSLSDPGAIWTRIQLQVLGRTRSLHMTKLYEILASYHGRRINVWTVGVEELCDRLGVPETGSRTRKDETRHSYRRRFNALKERVIEPTLGIINADAVFRAEATYEAMGMGGKVHRVTFRCTPKKALPVSPPAGDKVARALARLNGSERAP